MKINTSKKVLTLKGEPYQSDGHDLKVGEVIAEALASSKMGGKMKLYSLALKSFTTDEVELDAADVALIKQSLEACDTYSTIIIGQVLEEVENSK